MVQKNAAKFYIFIHKKVLNLVLQLGKLTMSTVGDINVLRTDE